MRLQKFIAECGIASRRKAEELIVAGRVRVNGEFCTKLGTKINPALDKVSVKGELLKQKPKKIYIKLYKPEGFISSCSSCQGATILDLLKAIPERLYPVGRLDKDSSGLVLLTNDGELANRLMHPRYEHEKEYTVNVQFTLLDEQLEKLRAGVELETGKTLPAKVTKLGNREFRIILKEGKKRQIKMMLRAIGNRVTRLKRIRIGNIRLGALKPGEYEILNSQVSNLMEPFTP